jgi:acetoin:2,6-dichlorophenolindophenol oxidoreductase subunit beta
MPSTPYEVKGLLKAAIRDDNPVVIFEDKLSYQMKGMVPEEEYIIPLGQANILQAGNDITLVATSSMVQVCEEAAEVLRSKNISAEIIDVRSIVPLDEQTIVDSVKKTSRVIVVDEGHQSYGITSEIVSRISEQAFYYLDAPPTRIGAMDVPIPFSPALEDLTVPTSKQVVDKAIDLINNKF